MIDCKEPDRPGFWWYIEKETGKQACLPVKCNDGSLYANGLGIDWWSRHRVLKWLGRTESPAEKAVHDLRTAIRLVKGAQADLRAIGGCATTGAIAAMEAIGELVRNVERDLGLREES